MYRSEEREQSKYDRICADEKKNIQLLSKVTALCYGVQNGYNLPLIWSENESHLP